MSKLRIGGNGRHLAYADGTPFIWLGDTIWCWTAYTAAEQDEYLAVRAAQGYTVLQTRLIRNDAYYRDDYGCPFFTPDDMALPYAPASKGRRPFELAACRPNEAYWRRTDEWLQKIAAHGLYAAPVLFWGDAPSLKRIGEAQMYELARWVGARYRDYDNIVWLTLGEGTDGRVPAEKVLPAVRGLRDGDTGGKLLSIHACTRTTTSALYWDELDFHTWQTSQWCAPSFLPDPQVNWQREQGNGNWRVWEAIAADCGRTPPKPVLDSEAWYEDAPLDPPPRYPSYRSAFGSFGQGCGAQAYHVRRRAYFTVLAGACGHTYGANPVWSHGTTFAKDGPGVTWRTALQFPGGRHMGHLKRLLAARPFDLLVPDQALVTVGQSDEYDGHVQAARASDGRYAYVYVADGHPIGVDLTGLRGDRRSASWFDPRTGEYAPVANVENSPAARFDPPGTPGLDNDWVLVVEAA